MAKKAKQQEHENGIEDRELVLADLLCQMAKSDLRHASDCEESLESQLDRLSDDELQQLYVVGRFVRTLDDVCQPNSETCSNEESKSAASCLETSDSCTNSSLDKIGKYTILELAGQGGFANVYKAFDETLQRHVAIKVPHANKLSTPRMRERFHREGRAAAVLSHDGIVSAYDAGSQNGQEYICYAWVDGTDLGHWLADRELRKSAPLSIDEVASAMEHLADAMGHAHARQILHRDLKPANILVARFDDRPWHENLLVADFGLVRELDTLADLTNDGEVLGTPAYMSPEQVRCDPKLGPPSDVHALGSVMYELLTGDPPHLRANYAATLLAIENDPVAEIQGRRSDVPRDLQAICMKCLEFEPGRRYKDAGELHADLVRFQHGNPVVARPVGPLGKLFRWSKRNPVVAGSLGAAVFSLVIGLTVTGWLLNKSLSDNQRILAAQNETQRLAQSNAQALDSILGSFQRMNPEAGGKSELSAREVLDAARDDVQNKFVSEPLTKARLMSELGRAYASLGLFVESVECHEFSFQLYEQNSGRLKPETINELQLLAQVQLESGRLSDSLDSHNDLLERARSEIENSEQVANQSKLALVKLQFRSGRAIDSIEALASTSEDFEDEESPLRNQLLTKAFGRKGMSQKAIETSKAYWEFHESTNGKLAPATLMAKRNYVLALTDAKRFKKALALSEDLLQSWISVKGNDSASAMEQRELNGWLQLKAGNSSVALQIATNAIATGANRYGPTHPTTLKLKRLLARCQREQGEFELEAQTLREALSGSTEQSKSPNPAMLRIATALASCYRKQGMPAKAVETLSPYLDMLKSVDRMEASEVNDVRREMIRALSESGRPESAIGLSKKSVTAFERQTDYEGGSFRSARLMVIHLLLQAKEFESAVAESRVLIDHWQKMSLEKPRFARNSKKSILVAKSLLAMALNEVGDFEAADRAAVNVLNDPELIKPFNHLMLCVRASVLSSKGDHKNSEILRTAFGRLKRDYFPHVNFTYRFLVLLTGESVVLQAEQGGKADEAVLVKDAVVEMRAEMYGTSQSGNSQLSK